MVVDDTRTDRVMARRLLERMPDLQVLEAEDGMEALALLETRPVAFVVTDLKMPEMDGLGLVRELREHYPDVPVVLMTAYGSEDIAAEALAAGAVSYIPKSRLADLLPRTIESITTAVEHARFERAAFDCLREASVVFHLENDPEAVCLLRAYLQDRVEAIVGCDSNDRMRVGMALEEALLNAVFHGNLEVSSDLRKGGDEDFYELAEQRRSEQPYSDRYVEVEVSFSPEQATFRVRDQGPGFDYTALPDPTDPSQLADESGRGVRLIQTFMDEVQWNEAGNEIYMVKNTTTPPA
jgi:CheY-like chemotaxis protein/anti-sigma regulatory factor (Ser/Thr protein kinase)